MKKKWRVHGRPMACNGIGIITWIVFILVPALASAGESVILFHAGSLTAPLAEIEKQFEAAHPEIDIVRKGGGSTRMARMIADQGMAADIMASADYQVIDKTLIPKNARWNIRFATNQLVLCYTPKSRYAREIDAQNWFTVLERKDVVWGHSDPNLDPCGYRSLMVLQLAEKFHASPGLYDRLIANRPPRNIRPKAKELVELLKSGKMDYAWEYLSVAVQQDLHYITLDDHINLGNYALDPYYRQAAVKVSGKKPGTWITRTGKSCTYGVTLINKIPDTSGGALKFLEFMLAPEGGLKVLEAMGQPPFIPARVSSDQVKKMLPGNLPALVEVKN